MQTDLSRRQLLQTTAAAGGLYSLARAWPSFAEEPAKTSRYKIAACDWMLLKRQKLGAFQLAKDCGMDGVEVDMGSLGDSDEKVKNELLKDDVRQTFLESSQKLGIEICSLAVSGMYAQSLVERPNVEAYLESWVRLIPQMGCKVGFLPLGTRCDLKKFPELWPKVVARLQKTAKLAEAAHVDLGIETTLAAAETIRLLDEIGSPNVKVYYNPENTLDQGYDLEADLRLLGKDRICQFHYSDRDGVRLDDPTCRLDSRKVKVILDDLGWSGWLVIERSRTQPARDVKGNFSANAAFLRSVFCS
jgi:sugar phosphate isomerase/epimerase